jgi:membrane-associated protease RseP (regulator of RpoE activity)
MATPTPVQPSSTSDNDIVDAKENLVDLTSHPSELLRVQPPLPAGLGDLPDGDTVTARALPAWVGPLGLAGVIAWCAAVGQLRTLAVVAALAFMIVFHELGHYLAARATGMKATEFFLGFGPRLWSFRRGETEFGVKAFPVGGYVKVIGMTNLEPVDPADEARTYRRATYPRRVLLASAGTLAHFVLAFVLLLGLNSGLGNQTGFVRPVIGSVKPLEVGPSPAAAAGIASGDRITAINGIAIKVGSDVGKAIASGKFPLAVTVSGPNGVRTVPLTPVRDVDGVMRIGVQWDENAYGVTRTRVGVLDGSREAVSKIVSLVPETWGGLFKFFAPSNLKTYGTTLGKAATNEPLTRVESEGRMSSAVGITRLMRDASRDDIRVAIELFAIINIFVGMFNMLPLLPLDGGHVLVATYERLRSFGGRRHFVDFRRLLPVTYVVLLVMAVIGFSSLYLDITKPLTFF